MLRSLKRVLFPLTMTRYGLCTSRAMMALDEMVFIISHNNDHGDTIDSEKLLRSLIRAFEQEFFWFLNGLTTQAYALSYALGTEYDPARADDVTTSSVIAAVRHQLGMDIQQYQSQGNSGMEEEYRLLGSDFVSWYPKPERFDSLNTFLDKIAKKVKTR